MRHREMKAKRFALLFSLFLGALSLASCGQVSVQEDSQAEMVSPETIIVETATAAAEELTPATDAAETATPSETPNLRPVCVDKNTGAELSYQEALEIARESVCAPEGLLEESYFCNEETGTWWIDLEVEKSGCAPACVIDVNSGATEINWRCTGLLPEVGDSPANPVGGQDVAAGSGSQVEVSFEAVSFSYDDSLASGVSEQFFQEEVFLIVDSEIIPEHAEYAFEEYRTEGTLHEPRIWVYPLEPFAQGNYFAAGKIDQLQRILSERPAEIETAPFSDSIPMLPLFNAGQMMASQFQYLDFQNGSGLRFLTQLGQAYMPINNGSMFYTFQGITSDGQSYVAAIFPVSHPSLPSDGTMPEDAEAFIDSFEAYIGELEEELDGQDEASFGPDLRLLDALISSLNVTGVWDS